MNKRNSNKYKVFELFARMQKTLVLPDETKANIKERVLQQVAITPQEEPQGSTAPRVLGFALDRRYVLAFGLVLMVGTLGTTVYAAQNSLPGETLYRVKQAVEKTVLQSVFTDNWKSNMEVYQANERIGELVQLREQNKVEYIPQAEEAAKAQYAKAVEHLTIVRDKLTERGNTTAADKVGKQIESLNTRAERKDVGIRQKPGNVDGVVENVRPGSEDGQSQPGKNSSDDSASSGDNGSAKDIQNRVNDGTSGTSAPDNDGNSSDNTGTPTGATKPGEEALQRVSPEDLL